MAGFEEADSGTQTFFESSINPPIAARRSPAPAEAPDGRGWMAERERVESTCRACPINRTILAAYEVRLPD